MNEPDRNRLQGVALLTAGQQAALRREAGKNLREADAQALQAFFTALPYGTPAWEQEKAYVVACLMCLWKADDRRDPIPFAECLRRVRGTGSDGKFRNLLDTPWQNDDGYFIEKLTRLTRQIHRSEGGLYPDFEQLLEDLKYWNAQNRGVQRRWMEQYIGQPEQEGTEASETTENEEE